MLSLGVQAVRAVELALVLLYMLACVGIAVWANTRVRGSQEDYWVANRRVGTFANSWAMMSALASGGSVLGLLGLAYVMGIPYVLAMFAGAAAGFPMAAVLVARRLRRMEILTVTEFFTRRYPETPALGWLVPLLIVLCMGTYIVAQLKAAGLAAVYVLGIPYGWAVAICALVFIIYVSVGGMWAVTVTDVLQGMLVFFMVAALAALALYHFGGPAPLLTAATLQNPGLGELSRDLGWHSYLGAYVLWLLAASVSPHLVMRVFTARNVKSARAALNYAVLLYSLMVLAALFALAPAAELLFAALEAAEADTVFLRLVEHFLPAALGGLAVAAVLAAVMSTTDALLLAASSALAHDIYGRLRPNAQPRELYRVSLASVWVVGLSALAFAFEPPALLTLLYSAAIGLLGAGLFVPLTAGIWWRRARGRGALVALLGGAGLYLWLTWGSDLPVLTPILFALPFSAFLMWLMSRGRELVAAVVHGASPDGETVDWKVPETLSAAERRVLAVLAALTLLTFGLIGVDAELWGLSAFGYSMGALMVSVPILSLYLFRNEP